MANYVKVEGLQIAKVVYQFVNEEALVYTSIKPQDFWREFSKIIHDMSPENGHLLAKRLKLQKEIDTWSSKLDNVIHSKWQ